MSLTQHQQLYEVIQKSNAPLIAFRKDHNGDAIAASLALAELLKKLGRQTEIVSPGFELPHLYKFLPQSGTIKQNLENIRKIVISLDTPNQKYPEIDYRVENEKMHIHLLPQKSNFSKHNISIVDDDYKHDLIITLNTPDLESLDHLYTENTDFFFQVPIVNIDHSPENEHYGHLNLVNITCSSVSEMIYDFTEHLDSTLLDETIATYLLTGMIEKTKSFKIPTVTPKSLNIASQLMAAGARRDSIIKNLYQRQTVSALRLWGRILLDLKTDDQQKIAWAQIKEQDFNETNAIPEDLTGVIDELIVSIPTVELTVIFYERNGIKSCLIKSEKNFDLRSLFIKFNPGGNKNLIKFELTVKPAVVLDILKSLI